MSFMGESLRGSRSLCLVGGLIQSSRSVDELRLLMRLRCSQVLEFADLFIDRFRLGDVMWKEKYDDLDWGWVR